MPVLARTSPLGIGDVAHRILSHTADTGVEASADSLAGLITELATGMFDSMGSVLPGRDEDEVEIDIEVVGSTREDLVVGALSDLLYESETRDLFLCDFTAARTGDWRMELNARGVPITRVETQGPPIKAVTYHDLEVVETSDGYTGRVYFDV
ncbi:MAG: archease [Acidimicrobiia bacterium]